MRTADISGTQRKVVDHSITPVKVSHGNAGIPVSNGRTLPFTVSRAWSAPSGVYPERFYIIDPQSREVFFEGPGAEREIWGLQSETIVEQTIREPIVLAPGTYAVVFALGGVMGGEVPVEAFEVAEEAA
jgi:hypothetical protein